MTRGPSGQARAARAPDSAARAEAGARVRSATTGPTTMGPGAKCSAKASVAATAAGSSTSF